MIKQNGARYQIIRALAEDGMLPASELAEKPRLPLARCSTTAAPPSKAG